MLCALDFALSEDVDEAIADLARRQIIGAVSCLAISDLWPVSAQSLGRLGACQPSKLQIGLSLRITGHFSPLTVGFFPENRDQSGYLPRMEDLQSAAGSLSLEERVLEGEFRAQIRRFIAHTGQVPDFIALEDTILHFGAIAKAVTASLRKFSLTATPILCPQASGRNNLYQRIKRKYLWRSDLHLDEPWQRRSLLVAMEQKRLPPRSSWCQDGQVWTALTLARKPDARLLRMDPEPENRVAQYHWFDEV